MKQIDKLLPHYIESRSELVDYATRVIGDRAQGEEVVQEAYLRLHASIDTPLNEPLGYIKRIVRNLSIDKLRRRKFERHLLTDDGEIDAIGEKAPGPEQSLGDRQELAIVIEAMSELPERTRIALEMHRLEGRKLSEIADHLGVSVTMVHNLVYEGLDYCRQRLTSPKRKL